MTADPIAAWHDLLGGGMAAETSAWLDARQRDRGLAFGDRALCTVMRPRFLRTAEHDALRTASRACAALSAAAGRLLP